MSRLKHRKLPLKVPPALKKKRLRFCRSGKKVFRSLTDANIFLTRMQLREKNERRCGYRKIPVRAYRCNVCGYYHVTSRVKWYN